MQLLLSLFIVVLLMGWTLGSCAPQHPNERSSSSKSLPPPQQEANREAVEFESIQGERGKTEDGIPFSYHLYKSSDGVGVATTVENRESPIRASKALQRKIKKAVKIIERGPKLNEKGQQIGERVVVIFVPNDSYKEQASVLWTDGTQFYYIESSSLRHVLEFEKKFYQ